MRNGLADRVVIGGFPTIRLTRAELAAVMVRDRAANPKERPAYSKLVFSSNRQGYERASGFLEIIDFYKSLGVPVIGRPQDAMSPTDLFNDTLLARMVKDVEHD